MMAYGTPGRLFHLATCAIHSDFLTREERETLRLWRAARNDPSRHDEIRKNVMLAASLAVTRKKKQKVSLAPVAWNSHE
jgi:hypothetical protein